MNPSPGIAVECVEGYVYVAHPAAVLILRRPPSRGSIWVPVSGKVEASDPDLPSALLRELSEETGFSRPQAVHDLDWAVPFDGPDGRPWRLHAFGVELSERTDPTLSSEHVEHVWLPPEVARSRLHYEDNRGALDRLVQRGLLAGAAR